MFAERDDRYLDPMANGLDLEAGVDVGEAPADALVLGPADGAKVPRIGRGVLTQADIDRVLSDDSPTWMGLRRKLERFRYCTTCESWRSGTPAPSGEPGDLVCRLCGDPMEKAQAYARAAAPPRPLETLTCQTCGNAFTRPRSPGRKPRQCPDC